MREIHQPDGTYHYVFGPYAEPIAHVALGEEVAIYTVDAFVDGLTSDDQKPSQVLGPYLNPQTGPIYIDGVDLLNDLAADGYTDVIYLGYYYTKNGILLVDDLEEAIVYGDAKLAQACTNSVVNCPFIDPRSTIRDSDIIADGVHPSATGSRKLADLIWPVLRTKL